MSVGRTFAELSVRSALFSKQCASARQEGTGCGLHGAARPGRRSRVTPLLGPAPAAPLGPAKWTLGEVVVRRAPELPAFDDTFLGRLSLFAENSALAMHLEGQRSREPRVLADPDRYPASIRPSAATTLRHRVGEADHPPPHAVAGVGGQGLAITSINCRVSLGRLRHAISDGQPGPGVPPRCTQTVSRLSGVRGLVCCGPGGEAAE